MVYGEGYISCAKRAVEADDVTGESLGGHLACYQASCRIWRAAPIVQGTKLSYSLACDRHWDWKKCHRVLYSFLCSPWSPGQELTCEDERWWGGASLCGLQLQFLLTVAPCRSAVFPRNKRRFFSSLSVPSVCGSEISSLGEGLCRVAPFPAGCCKGQAGLLALPFLHTALSTLCQSPVCLLSSALPISE